MGTPFYIFDSCGNIRNILLLLYYARDAYREMNKSLHGEEMALGFHEGYLGALGRIFRVIERNMSEKWRQDDNSAIRILDAISLTPKERARI